MAWKVATAKWCACLALLAGTSGCTISKFYALNGASIDYNVYRTVSFGDFPIRASLVYPPLQQVFENKMRDMVSQNTRLATQDNPNSDVRFEGEITGYQLTPQAVSDNAYASQTRLTIQVHVRYTDNRNDALSVDQNFSAYRDFDSNQMLTDVQDALIEEITDDLKDLIFNATWGNW